MAPKKKVPLPAAAKKPARRKSTKPETAEPECLVVGIGASAGGLEVFRRFVEALPADTGMAFVIIQHLDPKHRSRMTDILGRFTALPVLEAKEGLKVKPNHVYLNPPNQVLGLSENSLRFQGPVKIDGRRMVIDRFFHSLAEARKERAICIVLSGMGSDGSLGLRDVKAAGGMAMAQDPETAEYDAMPRAAIGTGYVDFVLPVEKMPERLVAYARHPFTHSHEVVPSLMDREPGHFQTILTLLRAHTDHDFRCYKTGTLNRRIQRRMSLRQVEALGDYVTVLRKHPEEVQALFRDLLIGVTGFFRESEAWDVLAEDVLAPLVAGKEDGEMLRIWVPGCATGEEAYSLAIAAAEQVEKQQKNLEIQIFATDIDETAVSLARAGLYSPGALGGMSEERKRRYFSEEGDAFRVSRKVREGVIFAVQNLVADPPFSKVDLVSCRNVMIYLSGETQTKLLEMFHFALNEGGFLFLGNSESISRLTELFAPVSKQWRLYRRIGSSRRTRAVFPVTLRDGPLVALEEKRAREAQSFSMLESGARLLLERFAPACVLVTPEYHVRYTHGPLRDYLSVPSGEPSADLLKMALPGLASKLRGVIRRALESGSIERTLVPAVERGEETAVVEVQAEIVPRPKDAERLVLVTFRNVELAPEGSGTPASKPGEDQAILFEDASEMVSQMEHELRVTRDDLQSTIEELKVSNEEVMSMNEELQSTNEELETSREELQSLNEELTTVNAQLEEKIHELEQSNDDVQNLLRSTEIATLFLDRDFRIRQFTQTSGVLLHLLPGDVGRPVSDLAPRMEDSEIFADARKVLEHLVPVEREVRAADGRWFIRAIRPYRTAENRIDGVVLTFLDVSRLHRMTSSLEVREAQQAAVAQLGVEALAAGEPEALFDLAVRLVSEKMPCEMSKVLELLPGGESLHLRAGVGWKPGLVGVTKVDSGPRSQAGVTLHAAEPIIVEDLATDHRFNGPQLLLDHGVVSGISVLIGTPEKPWGVLGAHTAERRKFTRDDVNFMQTMANVLGSALKRQESEILLRANEARLQLLTDAVPAMIAFVGADGRYQFVNRGYAEKLGKPGDEVVGQSVREVLGERFLQVEAHIARALEGERVEFGHKFEDAAGRATTWQVTYVPLFDDARKVLGYCSFIVDLSERARFEDRLRLVMESMSDAFLSFDRKGRVRFANDAAAALFGFQTAELLERSRADLFADQPAAEEVVRLAGERGEETDLAEYTGPDQRHYHIRCVPAEGQVSVFFVDATAETEARRDLLALNDRLEELIRERTQELSETARVLSEREQELSVLANNVPACFAYVSADFVCRYVNRGFQEALGKPTSALIGKPLEKVIGKRAFRVVEPYALQVLRGQDTRFEERLTLPKGKKHWLNATLVPRRAEDDTIEGFFFLGLDITEAKELEGKLVRVVDEEKLRFANELHDGIGSLLSGLSFRVEAFSSDVRQGSIPKMDDVKLLGDHLNDAIAQTRALAHGLNPVPAKTDGLATSLLELTNSFHTTTGIEFELDCPESVHLEDPFLANNLYRIAQEATSNAVKHSGCSRVVIRLRGGAKVQLTVTDNGRGVRAEDKPGMGHGTMRYRAAAMGGTLEIHDGENGGTEVLCVVPAK